MSSPTSAAFTITPNDTVTWESNYTLSHITGTMTLPIARQMSSVGVIVGVAIGSVVFLLVILLFITYLCQRKVKTQPPRRKHSGSTITMRLVTFINCFGRIFGRQRADPSQPQTLHDDQYDLRISYLNVQPEQSDVLESKPAVLETVYLESEVYVYGEASTSTSDLERRSCQSEIQQSDRYLAMQSDNSDKFTGPESGLETCIALQPKHVNQSERSPKEARVSHSSKRKESKEVFQEKDTANDGIYGSINTAFSNNHEESHSVELPIETSCEHSRGSHSDSIGRSHDQLHDRSHDHSPKMTQTSSKKKLLRKLNIETVDSGFNSLSVSSGIVVTPISWNPSGFEQLLSTKDMLPNAIEKFYSMPDRQVGKCYASSIFAIGEFDCNGGKLYPAGDMSVSLTIPAGALKTTQLVYLLMSYDNNESGDHTENLSPTIKCGPDGLQFEVSAVLTIPHSAVNMELETLTCDGSSNQWKVDSSKTGPKIILAERKNVVSISIWHFTRFKVSRIPVRSPATGCSAQSLLPAKDGKLLSLNVFKQGEKARIYFINAPPSSHALKKEIIEKENILGFSTDSPWKEFCFYCGCGDLVIEASREIQGQKISQKKFTFTEEMVLLTNQKSIEFIVTETPMVLDITAYQTSHSLFSQFCIKLEKIEEPSLPPSQIEEKLKALVQSTTLDLLMQQTESNLATSEGPKPLTLHAPDNREGNISLPTPAPAPLTLHGPAVEDYSNSYAQPRALTQNASGNAEKGSRRSWSQDMRAVNRDPSLPVRIPEENCEHSDTLGACSCKPTNLQELHQQEIQEKVPGQREGVKKNRRSSGYSSWHPQCPSTVSKQSDSLELKL